MREKEVVTLRLDSEANIAEILNDPLGLTADVEIGAPFARLAVAGSLAKALSFLAEIRTNGVAFDWEFNVLLGGLLQTFHFTGGNVDGQVLVIGASNAATSIQFYEEMMRINNDQVNALRQAYGGMQRDRTVYDEISRLNNELVDTQRELAKKNAELVQLNREKNHIIGIAAHDLRNPIHAILMLSQFLAEDIHNDELQEFVAEIQSSSHFMAQLIDDLLDVAKIESGMVELDYTQVDMNAMIRENVERNRLLAARKHVKICLQEEEMPPAQVDRSKLEQVLNNLITNAVKFTPEGGKVEVRLSDIGSHICLEVQDWGMGIPSDVQSRLFTPFLKGQTGTAGEKSTGLGLTIVKRIVEGHGGSIRFESAVGVGTTFYIAIPCTPTKSPAN